MYEEFLCVNVKFVHSILWVVLAQQEPNNEQIQFEIAAMGKQAIDASYLSFI